MGGWLFESFRDKEDRTAAFKGGDRSGDFGDSESECKGLVPVVIFLTPQSVGRQQFLNVVSCCSSMLSLNRV